MQCPSAKSLFLLSACFLLLKGTEVKAQWGGYGVSGNIGSGFRYTRDKQGDALTWTTGRTDNYTLGVTGKILDPRLATFNVAGALSMNDFDSNQETGAEDSRLLSFTSNLSLLSGKPYPLDLRFSKSHLFSGTDTDVLSFGGSWRIAYKNLPGIFLNFDQVNLESRGDSRSDTTFTTGTLRLTKRLFDSDLDAEFGLQNFADDIVGASTLRHFGRLSGTTQYSQATTMRLIGDYFLQEGIRSFGSNFSLINRPDPTLSRSLSLGVRNLTGDEESETTIDANGAVSKAFNPFPTLSVTPFGRVLLSQDFASDGAGNSTLVNGSTGTSAVSSYFRPVLVIGDYGVGLSYNQVDGGQTKLGTTHEIHVGLQSRTLDPYHARGDYTFTLERTLTDRNRHLVSMRADGPLTSNWFFRSFAEFFNEDATFSGSRTEVSTKHRTVSFGGAVSYTGIRQLYFDFAATAQRLDTDSVSSWVTRVTANLNYRPTSRITLMLNALRESDTLNALTRYEVLPRVIYQFGRTTIDFEYRFELRENFGQPGNTHSVAIQINRPFRFDL